MLFTWLKRDKERRQQVKRLEACIIELRYQSSMYALLMERDPAKYDWREWL